MSSEHAARAASLPVPAPTSRLKAWSLTPRQKKSVLALHIGVSVGLFGIYAALFILGTIAATAADPAPAAAAYEAMGMLRVVIPFGAAGVLLTGVILGLGTTWGLVKHYWIVTKLALTAVVVPVSVLIFFPSLQRAIADARATPLSGAAQTDESLVLLAATGTVVLLLAAATAIAVFKPWGAIGRTNRTATVTG